MRSMKPNFHIMSRQELRSYLLQHRADVEAISAYVQKINGEHNWVTCAALSSPEDLDNYPDFLDRVRETC
jgi:hypothetical protein